MAEYLSSIYETLGSVRPQQKQTKQQNNTKTKKTFLNAYIFNVYKIKEKVVSNSIKISIQFIQWAEGRGEAVNPQTNIKSNF